MTQRCTLCLKLSILSYIIYIPYLSVYYRVIQFVVKLGCSDTAPDSQSEPILLQYSINGGVVWTTMEQFDFSKKSNTPMYIAIRVPVKARTGATRVRWWQSTDDGTYLADWALDQVCIQLTI